MKNFSPVEKFQPCTRQISWFLLFLRSFTCFFCENVSLVERFPPCTRQISWLLLFIILCTVIEGEFQILFEPNVIHKYCRFLTGMIFFHSFEILKMRLLLLEIEKLWVLYQLCFSCPSSEHILSFVGHKLVRSLWCR